VPRREDRLACARELRTYTRVINVTDAIKIDNEWREEEREGWGRRSSARVLELNAAAECGDELLSDALSTAIATEKRGCVKKGDDEVHETACVHLGGCSHRRTAWDRSGLAERRAFRVQLRGGKYEGEPAFFLIGRLRSPLARLSERTFIGAEKQIGRQLSEEHANANERNSYIYSVALLSIP